MVIIAEKSIRLEESSGEQSEEENSSSIISSDIKSMTQETIVIEKFEKLKSIVNMEIE